MPVRLPGISILAVTSCLTALSLSGLVLTVPTAALANPVDGVVAGGSALISSSGSKLDVMQSTDKAVIDWRSFDIAPSEHTQFHQPSASSFTLNRINDTDPSRIEGALTSNGHVMLVNPNGVFFGHGARVDVGGLTATTANIRNEDFMAGRMEFSSPGSSKGTIINEGTITAADAGLVSLVAPSVENRGTITATLGAVNLASGETFALDMAGDGLLSVAVDKQQLTGVVKNSGRISADGGKIMLTAAAARDVVDSLITNTGVIEANTLGTQKGSITLYAEGSNAVKGNVATDKGKKSGASTVENSGLITAKGMDTGEAGGFIKMLGDHVRVKDGARLNASGMAGGGKIHTGGAYMGGGNLPTAISNRVEKDTVITASAISEGDGGRVIVWSDYWTDFFGTIAARGGMLGGDGGFIETSGHYLNATGSASASAPYGKGGEWLLDPYDINITSAVGQANVDPASVPTTTGVPSTIVGNAMNVNLAPATILGSVGNGGLNDGTNVTVSTDGGAQNGNIVVVSDIAKTTGGDATLHLKAAGRIIINNSRSITSTSGKLHLILNPNKDGTATTTNGGYVQVGSNAIITTNGGNLTIAAGSDPVNNPVAAIGRASTPGVSLSGALGGSVYTLGGGNASIYGRALNDGTCTGNGCIGVRMFGTTLTTTGAGTITINGTGGNVASGSFGNMSGVVLDTSTISSRAGALAITGVGGSDTINNPGMLGNAMSGIYIFSSTVKTTGVAADGVALGALTINGTSGYGGNNSVPGNAGIAINDYQGPASLIQVADGTMVLTGTGNQSGSNTVTGNHGIWMVGNSTIESTGISTGTITVNATGATGAASSHGLFLDPQGGPAKITSVNGAITVTGIAATAGATSYGVAFDTGGKIESTGAAPITVRGSGTSSDIYTTGTGNEIGGASATGGIMLAMNDFSFTGLTLQQNSTGTLTLKPYSAAVIGVGTGGSGNLLLPTSLFTGTTIGNITNITIGDTVTTTGIVIGDMSGTLKGINYTFLTGTGIHILLDDSVLDFSSTTGQSVTFTSGGQIYDDENENANTITTKSGAITLSATSGINLNVSSTFITTGNAGTGANVALNNALSITGGISITAGTGTVTFGSTINAPGGGGLTASGAAFSIGGHIGQTWNLGSVSLTSTGSLSIPYSIFARDGTIALSASGGISTAGNILISSTFETGGNITFTGPLTVASGSLNLWSGDSPTFFSSTVNGPGALSVSASNISMGGAFGGTTPLGAVDLSTTSGSLTVPYSIATTNANITLTGTGGNVILGDDSLASALSAGSGTIAVTSNLTLVEFASVTLSAPTGTITLSGTVNGHGDLTATATTLNLNGTIGGTTRLGNVILTSTNALTLPSISTDAGGLLRVRTTGAAADITIPVGRVLTSGRSGNCGEDDCSYETAIELISGRNFHNNSGLGSGVFVLTFNSLARWLVYSTNPASDSINGLQANYRVFSCTYGGSCPVGFGTSNDQDYFLYSYTPTLTITPNDLAAITYGAAVPSLTGYAYTATGWLASSGVNATVDTAFGISGSLNGSTNYTQGSNIGDYSISHANGSLSISSGYGFTYATNSTAISVDPRTLTIGLTGTASKQYDGALTATLASNNYQMGTGAGTNAVYSTDNVSISTTAGTYDTKDVDTGKTVTVTGLTLAGAKAGNYTLSSTTTNGNIGTITQAPLTITVDDATRAAGAADPAFTASYSGFLSDDDASDVSGLAFTTTATGASPVGAYAITPSGATATNYTIAFVDGVLTVTQAIAVNPPCCGGSSGGSTSSSSSGSSGGEPSSSSSSSSGGGNSSTSSGSSTSSSGGQGSSSGGVLEIPPSVQSIIASISIPDITTEFGGGFSSAGFGTGSFGAGSGSLYGLSGSTSSIGFGGGDDTPHLNAASPDGQNSKDKGNEDQDDSRQSQDDTENSEGADAGNGRGDYSDTPSVLTSGLLDADPEIISYYELDNPGGMEPEPKKKKSKLAQFWNALTGTKIVR